ncbi:MAG: hypothetical protein JSU00_02115 [Acidobacteria bacterium]|nr:hypothetical protein [Acidobacteriota bacterium]
MSTLTRRELLAGAAAATVWIAHAQPAPGILIEPAPGSAFLPRLASRELFRGLTRLGLKNEIRLADASSRPASGDLAISLRVDSGPARESYSIAASANRVTIAGASDTALAYAVFEFLERQGAFFGIDGDVYPLDPPAGLVLPSASEPWRSSPRFAVRGLLPWPDFLNCITVYNEEDFRAYFESMLRMRFNTFGMHVYTGAEQWAESYLSFEFAGAGHLGFLDNSASHRWGYLPERTSRFSMDAAEFYDGEVFGSDATRLGRDPWEIAERTQSMLKASLTYAHRLGLRTGIGFEPYQIPDEIWRALPPEVKPKEQPPRHTGQPRFDIESVTAKKLLEARLAQLLEAYPDVDHVWLWQDEQMNWEGRKTGQSFSVTPFLQAYDFLRRHAPKKRLVLGGWGGVARDFDQFHKKLPMDVVFSCLSDTLGWDPIHEVFGKLEGRERWPIPWLEDDPAMWLPQFHVHRFERDLNLAEQYGCQGMIGIHWRHRIVDPTASYQARFSWDKRLAPGAYFQAYARTQAAGPRAARLAEVLTDTDKEQKLLCTGTKEVKDGHVVQHEFSGDYNEAFTFWNDYEPDPAIVVSQQQVAVALRDLANAAASPTEKERLEYLTRHVEFLVPYAAAWTGAHRLHAILGKAAELKKGGKAAEARSLVAAEGVPLWTGLAPEVRRAVLDFQSIVATRNDLGTLASIQNKLVRLALVRLRLSLQEFLVDLPPETESLYTKLIKPDPNAPVRLFLPTRPSMLSKGEKVRITIVVTGSQTVGAVELHTRAAGARRWITTPAKLVGRRTYQATLGPFAPIAPLVEYYVSASTGAALLTAPPAGGGQPYVITMA